MDKSKAACFSGHRKLPQDSTELATRLEAEVIRLIELGVVFFGAGGAVYTVRYAESVGIEVIRV